MSEFKDVVNRWLTAGLFYELNGKGTDFVRFTLGENDRVVGKVTLKAIKKLYMSCSDPTEYEFANKYLGGWAHWKELQECEGLKPYIAAWRDEFEIKIRAEAIKQIAVLAKSDKGYQAAKFLADCGWKTRPAGAPSKEEKEGFKNQLKEANKLIENDAERLGIYRIK
jgi:hypothetical protein